MNKRAHAGFVTLGAIAALSVSALAGRLIEALGSSAELVCLETTTAASSFHTATGTLTNFEPVTTLECWDFPTQEAP